MCVLVLAAARLGAVLNWLSLSQSCFDTEKAVVPVAPTFTGPL